MVTLPSLVDIKGRIDKAEQVCFFGAGNLLKECFHPLERFLGRRADFICDNAREKWGEEYFGVKCISPPHLRALGAGTAVIITAKAYDGIGRQLNDLGMENVYICVYGRNHQTVLSIQRLEERAMLGFKPGPFRNPVQGKWTLITGAARGIGRQIAVEMAKLGSHLIVHARSLSHVHEVNAACSQYGVQVVPIAAEFTQLDQVEMMLESLERAVPQVDIIFNNAGISPPCPMGFWTVSSQDYLTSYMVNTVTPIRICLRLIPPMIRKGFGRIIHVTSSIERRPGEMAYACSKAGLNKFAYDLGPTLQNTGVMMTLVDPGWLRTDMGGPNAPHPVESVIPGALLGALLDGDINGRWFSAQDYVGLSIEEAVHKARSVSGALPGEV